VKTEVFLNGGLISI